MEHFINAFISAKEEAAAKYDVAAVPTHHSPSTTADLRALAARLPQTCGRGMDDKCKEHGCYWKAENEHLKKCLLENFEEATAEVNALRAALQVIANSLAPGSRDLNSMLRDMTTSRDIALASLKR